MTLETRTRVLLLQHPRERDMPIGTAHMASLCLPHSELHVGIRFGEIDAVRRAVSDPARPAMLLYPDSKRHPDQVGMATDLGASTPHGDVTLVVFDGTWAQTKKLLRLNPELAALPRVSFVPPTASDYRIRKEPDLAYVSTIEALAYALGILEGEASRFLALKGPFRAMVDAQIAYAQRGTARSRHKKKPPPTPRIPAALTSPERSIVCVVGEANAWPYDAGGSREHYPDEIVHWVAHRLGTGETLDVIVRPSQPLSPTTPGHIALTPEALDQGGTRGTLHAAFAEFLRPSDVVAFWGHYAAALFVKEGGALPSTRVDLRGVAREITKRKVGTIDDYAASLARSAAPLARGRAGERLAQVVAIARHFREAAQGETATLPPLISP